MFTKNIFNQKPDALVDMIDKINEADYKVKMEALKGNQHKIDKNKNGKVDAHDFKILRGEKKKVEEASPFDWKNTPSQLKKKPGETTGHDSKKTSTGTEYTKKAPKKPVEESIEQVDEAMRIVSKHGVGTGEHHAVVKRDPEWNEYQVHFYKGGKHMGEGPVSHHDDKADAQSTADTEVKRMNAKKNEDFNLDDMDPALVEEFMQTEEFEQLDELSKKTLRSYFDKSHKDAAQHYKAGEESQKAGDKDGEKTHNKKFQKRIKGQYDASKRHNSDEYQRQQKLMAKEDVEQTDEAATMQPKGPARVDVPAYKRVNMKPLSLKDVVTKSTEKKNKLPNAVKEESEQIDELSNDTLKKYVVKSDKDMDNHWDKNPKKYFKRSAGQRRALTKLGNRGQSTEFHEESEHLDELSKKTLSSYAKKATDDVSYHSFSAGLRSSKDPERLKDDKKAMSRQGGVNKAIDRLAKEEFEHLDEAKGSYDLYHSQYSGAVHHGLAHHASKEGLTVHDDDYHHHVSMGPRKPAEGETVSHHLPAKDEKGNDHMIHMQVYNKGGDNKPYELNTYSSKVPKRHVKEDSEQIDELSRSKLQGYVHGKVAAHADAQTNVFAKKKHGSASNTKTNIQKAMNRIGNTEYGNAKSSSKD
jgi:hypothetical protein